jgi:copper chaperone
MIYTPGGKGYRKVIIPYIYERCCMSKKVVLHAPDISCDHCAMTIKRELAGVQGISGVQVDVANKTVELEYDDDQVLNQVRAILADIGYPVTA